MEDKAWTMNVLHVQRMSKQIIPAQKHIFMLQRNYSIIKVMHDVY